MAIEALRNLDRGNRVVDRCVQYLLQVSLALARPGESVDRLNCLAWTETDIAYSTDTMLNHGFLNNDPAASQMQSTDPLQQLQLLNMPMDMDLSEFMINTNVDILSRYYDGSQ